MVYQNVATYTLRYRILRAISHMESVEERDEHMVELSADALRTNDNARDMAVMDLLQRNYITGIHVLKNLDGMRNPVILWSASYPSLTPAGRDYLESSREMKAERDKARGFSIE